MLEPYTMQQIPSFTENGMEEKEEVKAVEVAQLNQIPTRTYKHEILERVWMVVSVLQRRSEYYSSDECEWLSRCAPLPSLYFSV